MGKIITIGREFGSGGRELAKRLAEYLGLNITTKKSFTKSQKTAILTKIT